MSAAEGALRLRLQTEVAVEEIEAIAMHPMRDQRLHALKQIAVVVQSEIDRARCEQLAESGATS